MLPKGLTVENAVPQPRGFFGSFIGKPKQGKTVTALKLAYHMNGLDPETFTPEVVARINETGSPVLVVETAGEGVDLYAPYFPMRIIRIPANNNRIPLLKDIIAHYANNPQEGVRTIVVDTFTAFWTGAGGVLDYVGQLGGKPQHWGDMNKTIEAPFFAELKRVGENNLLDLIFTVRMKDGITIEADEDGKMKSVTKAPDKPIQRAGWAYDTDFIFIPERDDKGAINVTFTGRYYGLTPERLNFRADQPRALKDFAGRLLCKLNRTVPVPVKELV
jgi:hypothetical protein